MDARLDTLPAGYASFLDDGTLTEVNTTLATLLGYTRAELLGWHIQKLLPAGARIFHQTHVFPMLKMQGRAEEIFLNLLTKDGKFIPVLMNAVRRDREGAFVSECVFLRMIQRNEFEDQLVQARRIAEQANASKAKFLSMMSHDLRTPLNAVSGYARLLSSGMQGKLEEEQLRSIERITSASGDLLRLINDILSFAQLDSGRVEVRLETVRVADAIERAEALVRLRREESALSFVARGCDDVAVVADPDRLQQVLLNLFTNAIKFTPDGGALSIDCARAESRVHIAVRDSGIGIGPDELTSIFEPFVQLNSTTVRQADRGVGLGLAISRELMRAMDGDLTVASAPGEGSTFTLDLPAAPAR
ncbi:MAG TPA: HAMP domain-containing sensor histidine kinase [Thermoanaerobaculia bacterium]